MTKSAYQELLEDVSDLVLDCSGDGRILLANRAACEITRYTHEELQGLSMCQLLAPECASLAEALLRPSEGQAAADGAEVQLVTGDGARVHLRMKARVERQDGRTERVRWIGRDMSALRRAQERVQHLEEHARLVFQISPDAVSINRLDDGTYVEVNEGFVKSTGYTREELIGRSSLELGIWAIPAERERLAAMLAQSGEVQRMEAQFRRKNGQVEPGLMSARITMFAGVPHILSVTRDLTSWNQARRALKESEAHLEQAQRFGEQLLAAIEHASDEVVIFDKDGLIQYCNPALLRSLGSERRDVIGQNMLCLQFGREGEEFLDRIALTLREGVAWSGRLSSRTKDGVPIIEDATVSPIWGGAQSAIGVVAVFRDVTQQIALEARLQQSQRLESIGRLAAGVAHDFNNLLTVINGYSSLLLMSLGGEDPARPQVQEIQNAGERAAALTQQLLAFSRKQVACPRPLNLNMVINEAEQMLRRILGTGNELRVDLAPDLGLVNSDPGQIHQILLNMTLNARDAMPTGGLLSIRTSNVWVDAAQAALRPGTKPGAFVSCVVSDTGAGMDAEVRIHIFEPFFTTKEVGKGTGLGLSTVYGIVRQNDGWIGVKSQPGMGTAFTICLPRTEAECHVAAVPVPSDPRGTETILLVEDQEEVRRLTAQALSERGYRVLSATSGETALELARNCADPIHLVLTDVLMPGMSGRELAERIRLERPEIAVLLMSGHDPAMAAEGRAAGPAIPLLSKPFTPAQLAMALRAVLDV